MKAIVILSVLATAVFATNVDQEWSLFKATYGKTYENNNHESRHRAVFQQRLAELSAVQAANPLAEMGITSEFDRVLTPLSEPAGNPTVVPPEELRSIGGRSSVDWRTVVPAVLTNVKHQGQCGSCWSFSLTEIAESASKIASSSYVLTNASEQMLVDCDTNNNGCNGGNHFRAIGWLLMDASEGGKLNGVLPKSTDYPYTAYTSGQASSCKLSTRTSWTPAVRISGVVNLGKSEADWASAVDLYGPIYVSLDATTLQSYRNGVITTCSWTVNNHAVVLVGYTAASGSTPAAWIVRNSWGKGWGESGYARIKRGSGMCGLGTQDAAFDCVVGTRAPAATACKKACPGTRGQIFCHQSNQTCCVTGCCSTGGPCCGGRCCYAGYRCVSNACARASIDGKEETHPGVAPGPAWHY